MLLRSPLVQVLVLLFIYLLFKDTATSMIVISTPNRSFPYFIILRDFLHLHFGTGSGRFAI